MATSDDTSVTAQAAKKKKRDCHFDSKWMKEFKDMGRSCKGN